MMKKLDITQANQLFLSLPKTKRIFTLSPSYVAADAQRDEGLEANYLCYQEEDSFWMHSFHKAKVLDTQHWDLQSPYGYGGPVTNNSDEGFLARAWSAHKEWCKQNNILVEFVRFHPIAENWRYYGGISHVDRATVAVQLNDRDLMSSYQPRVRTAIRKACATGVTAHWQDVAEGIERFINLYRESMVEIGASKYYLFTDAYFNELAMRPGVRLIECRQGNDLLAVGMFLACGEVLEYHLSASTMVGKRLGATNLLLHFAGEWALDSGFKWLYLGGGTDAREDNPLLFFKAGFSSCHLAFRIGYAIHNEPKYEQLKSRYLQANNKVSKVLFYRKTI